MTSDWFENSESQADRSRRIERLQSLGILDTGSEPAFDEIARLAAEICATSFARISFVDTDREWYKAASGLGYCEAPLSASICSIALNHLGTFVVPDLSRDPRFSQFPTVTGAPHLRFYAGAALRTSDGTAVGMLCVLDHKSRPEGLTEVQEKALTALAGLVMKLVDAHNLSAKLKESEDHYKASVNLSSHIPWTADPNGNILEVGPKWPEVVGMSREETLGTGWLSALHKDDIPRTLAKWTKSLVTGEPVDVDYRVRVASGQYKWVRATAAARRNELGEITRWYGTLEDVHERKLVEEELRLSEAQFREMADVAPFMVWLTDREGQTVYISRSWFEFTGQSPETAYKLGWLDIVHPNDVRRVEENFQQSNGAQKAFRIEYQLRTRAGDFRWVLDAASPRFSSDGKFLGYVGSVIDISEMKAAEAQIKASNQQLETVLASTSDHVMIIGDDWRIEYMNERAAAAFNGGRALIGKDLRRLMANAEYLGHYAEAMSKKSVIEFEGFSDELRRWFNCRAVGIPTGVIIFLKDISDQKRAWELIEHQARYDSLTDLPNRFAFHERLNAELDAGRGFALLLLDLDDFKGINDTYGHPAGDELLRQISEKLRRHLPERCMLARLGGDEFGIILVDGGDPEILANGLAHLLSLPLRIGGQTVRSGVSIGIACAPEDGSNADELFSNADIALYTSKGDGGGKARRFEREQQNRIILREALKQDLAKAVGEDQLALAFQPQYELSTGNLIGFEALIRWHHPHKGNVPPGDFIPLAEETGLIEEIGEWVLERACSEAANWPEHLNVAVNLSPVQFRSPTLSMRVLSAIERTRLNPAQLKLEVTESVLFANSASNIETLRQLKGLGVKISLDDFGTGFSSLSYLRSFSFDEIKIDRSFTNEIHRSPEAEAVIGAVASLARALRLDVTAEGIETEEQRVWLQSAGIRYGQGFLLGRPTDASTAKQLFARPVTRVTKP